jgi:hypothetical protein
MNDNRPWSQAAMLGPTTVRPGALWGAGPHPVRTVQCATFTARCTTTAPSSR